MRGESFKTWVFRQVINRYPMYFGTGGKVLYISANWQHAILRLKLNVWTRNYVGTIFGGSQFSAMDPFHLVMLMNILGKNYIVWDKSATIQFKRPGKSLIKADIMFSDEELAIIRAEVDSKGKYEFDKSMEWKDKDGIVISTVTKRVYVATKKFYFNRSSRH